MPEPSSVEHVIWFSYSLVVLRYMYSRICILCCIIIIIHHYHLPTPQHNTDLERIPELCFHVQAFSDLRVEFNFQVVFMCNCNAVLVLCC